MQTAWNLRQAKLRALLLDSLLLLTLWARPSASVIEVAGQDAEDGKFTATKDRTPRRTTQGRSKSQSRETWPKYEAGPASVRETGEFHDYADATPAARRPAGELVDLGFMKFAGRVAGGEFDASAEESEEWARSQTDPDITRVMDALGFLAEQEG